MNRLFWYALVAFGECILIAIMLLLFSKAEQGVMILNMIVLSIVYLLNVVGCSTLFKLGGSNSPIGHGLTWIGTWLYSVAVLVAVILFYWIGLSFAWQLVLHCVLLFFFLIGTYMSGAVVRHANKLEGKYKVNAQEIESLKLKARMLQAILYDGMNEGTRQEIERLVERVSYLIPNHSPLAATLEKQIEALMDTLSDAVGSRQPDEMISSLAGQCATLLKQRMALPNSHF